MIEDIDTKGWHLVSVPETAEAPGWAFTVGLHRNHAHPEIVIVGLPRETMETIVEGLASDVTHGARYEAGTTSAGVLEDLTCAFRSVNRLRYEQYLEPAVDYYGHDAFPAVQCVWPGPDNRLPDERGAEPELASLQPLLHAPGGLDRALNGQRPR